MRLSLDISFPVLVISILIAASQLETASSKNILVYGILGSYSQRISIWPLVEALSNNGHNVTFLSAYENKEKVTNSKIYDYAPKKWKEALGPWESHMSFYDNRKNWRMLKLWPDCSKLGIEACEALYSDTAFVNWLKSSKFDLVIVDSLMNECAYGMVHLFKAKLIVYGTQGAFAWFADIFGMPDESSSVTDIMFNFPPGNQMNFLQRFVNAMNPIVWKIFRDYWYFPILEDISRKGLGQEVPSFTEMEKNASLFMVTTHYSIDYPRSYPPNVLPVGGVVLSKKQKPLPKETEDFINSSKNGFVYVSFGTVAEFVNFEVKVQKEFIGALKDFPETRFLWKSTYEINSTLPANVYVTRWAPQQTVLAHPKIKAFITHSGLGSTAEAIYFAVPAICIPILAEQDMNAANVVSRGAGIKLEITTLKKHELVNAIFEILNNPTYREKMKRMSEVFKDRSVAALDSAVWWTEYVLRNDDSNDYLRSPSVGQPWWIRRQIDVWVTFVLLILIFMSIPVLIMYKFSTLLVRLVASPKKSSKKGLKKNQ